MVKDIVHNRPSPYRLAGYVPTLIRRHAWAGAGRRAMRPSRGQTVIAKWPGEERDVEAGMRSEERTAGGTDGKPLACLEPLLTYAVGPGWGQRTVRESSGQPSSAMVTQE